MVVTALAPTKSYVCFMKLASKGIKGRLVLGCDIAPVVGQTMAAANGRRTTDAQIASKNTIWGVLDVVKVILILNIPVG